MNRPAEHRCHALGCTVAVPPRLLMCRRHWDRVPRELQREVYTTVARRGPTVGASWAPWWRAAHRAIARVALADGAEPGRIERYLARELAFADRLEGSAPP